MNWERGRGEERVGGAASGAIIMLRLCGLCFKAVEGEVPLKITFAQLPSVLGGMA